nr:MAG TPA: hypothetical protein [Caudoviricetes sp.]
MFQLKENAKDIVNFISNSKDISKRDITMLNKLSYEFSKVPKIYTFYDFNKASNPSYISTTLINLFTCMSYVFNIQPTELIQLWINDRILFLPRYNDLQNINIKYTTNRFIQKHKYRISYIVTENVENNNLVFINDIDEIDSITRSYIFTNAINGSNYNIDRFQGKELEYLTKRKILHNTKNIIKELSAITNKEYKELTDHFINKSDLSLYPIAVRLDLYNSYAPIIKKLSDVYNIKVSEHLIIYIVLERLGIDLRKNIFNWCLKRAFRKLYDKEVEKENTFILSESVKKEIEKGRLSNKWFIL